MDDSRIIELYQKRSEEAIVETENKYGAYCYSIAYHILRNDEDSEECVNDTYLRAWNAIPPHIPQMMSTFLGKITRNLSLNRMEKYNAEKRRYAESAIAYEELEESIPSTNNIEQMVDEASLAEILNRFLRALPSEARNIFLRRYWYLCTVKEIAEAYGYSESKVKMSLHRTRKKLRIALEKEGISG